MSSASRWRAVAAIIAVAAAAAITFTKPVRLGLDLEGGTQIVLEAQDTEQMHVDDASTRSASPSRHCSARESGGSS